MSRVEPDWPSPRESSHVQGGSWAWQKDWIYRDGQLLGTDSAASGLRHAHNDHLGTPRVFSDVFGNYQERRHLYPFGEQALATGPAPVTMTFTGHERDGNWTTATADDLDYMMARYYHPQLGRFLSVDPGDGDDPRDPRTWNRFSYVMGSPLTFTDPLGLAASAFTDYITVADTYEAFFTRSFFEMLQAHAANILLAVSIIRNNHDKAIAERINAQSSLLASGISFAECVERGACKMGMVPDLPGGLSTKKAGDLIFGSLKRSKSYRSELAETTYAEIVKLSQGKGPTAKAAHQMKKLIEQSDRLRGKVRGKP